NKRMLGQPLLHGGRRVRGRVVEDDVQLSPAVATRDELEEAEELVTGVAFVTGSQDAPVGHLEGREQARQSVAPIVVGLTRGQARAQRQQRLRAIERLNLRLLIE